RSIKLRQRENIKHAALRCVFPQVRHGIGESQCARAIYRAQAAGHHRARPTANSAQDRHILLSVRSFVSDWLADDSRSGLESPKRLAAAGIYRLEPAVHGAVEHHIAGGYNGAAPDWKHLIYGPDLLGLDRIPGRENAAISTRPRIHPDIRAHVGRTGDVVR